MTDMILVRGGGFQMGDIENLLLKNSRPVHMATVSSFYISKYQVAQNEWAALLNDRGQRSAPLDDKTGNHPVTMVSWLEAVEYCNRLSDRECFQPCYQIEESAVKCDFRQSGYRLPTEAEWEYAARGGAIRKSFVYSGSDYLDDVGWHKGNSASCTHKRGQKKPNELGIYGMSGNVWEWCWDWYGAYTSWAEVDPLGPAEGDRRVYRGGSWVDFEYACAVSSRGSRQANRGYDDIGFRIVRAASGD